MGTQHADVVLDKAWSSVSGGDTVRWITPRFVKYGRVLERKDRSLKVHFFGESTARAIPDARWYFTQYKMNPQAEEQLVVVQYTPLMLEPTPPPAIPEAADAHDVWITVNEACEMLNMDAKQLRRYIRRGHIPAHKDKADGMWRIHRDRLRDIAAKHGWI